jgi:hypothetical protein
MEQCKKLAIRNNADVFGLQNGNECMTGIQGKGTDFPKYGRAEEECKPLGGGMTNQVYATKSALAKAVIPPPIVEEKCKPPTNLGLPKCKDYRLSRGIYPACGERVNVFGKPNFRELNFSIPIGEWKSYQEIRKIPGNPGFTIYGGDGNVSFVFPEGCKLKLTLNNGPNFSGPVTFVFTKTCPMSIRYGACGQFKFDNRWTYAQSIRCERID